MPDKPQRSKLNQASVGLLGLLDQLLVGQLKVPQPKFVAGQGDTVPESYFYREFDKMPSRPEMLSDLPQSMAAQLEMQAAQQYNRDLQDPQGARRMGGLQNLVDQVSKAHTAYSNETAPYSFNTRWAAADAGQMLKNELLKRLFPSQYSIQGVSEARKPFTPDAEITPQQMQWLNNPAGPR